MFRKDEVFVKDESEVANKLGGIKELRIWASCFLSAMIRNPVLEEMGIKRSTVIEEEIC